MKASSACLAVVVNTKSRINRQAKPAPGNATIVIRSIGIHGRKGGGTSPLNMLLSSLSPHGVRTQHSAAHKSDPA